MAVLKANGSFLKANGKILVKPEGGGLIYETDFSNFDVNTGIDTPKLGKPLKYTFSKITKSTRIIDNIELSCLHFNVGGSLSAELDDFEDYDYLSVEFITNKDSFQGLGCGCHVYTDSSNSPNCPFYNCYVDNRGIGALGFTTPEPGFFSTYYEMITSNSIDRRNVTRIITGGITIDKINAKAKAFIVGKKAATRGISFTLNKPIISLYTDDNFYNTQMNLFGIRIYKNVDKFEEME